MRPKLICWFWRGASNVITYHGEKLGKPLCLKVALSSLKTILYEEPVFLE